MISKVKKENVVMQALDESEEIWRGAVSKRFPLFSDIKIDKNPDPSKKISPNTIWQFYIDEDGKTMHTLIFEPKKVYQSFEKKIAPLYEIQKKEDIDKLLLDVLVYAHFHELGHPLDAPYSKSDRKRIDQAIFNGIIETGIRKPTAIKKAANAENMVLDMIDDTCFYARTSSIENDKLEEILEDSFSNRGYKNKKLTDGVMMIYHVIEISTPRRKLRNKEDDEKLATIIYSLSRIPYVMLFVDDEDLRTKEYNLFEDKIKENGLADWNTKQREKEIFINMLSEQDKNVLKSLGINEKEYYNAIEIMFNNIGDNSVYLEAKKIVAKTIYLLFKNEQTRYNAIKGYIKPFADLIPTTRSPQRDAANEGAGQAVDASDVLENILEGLSEEEANELLQELANEEDWSKPHKGDTAKKMSEKAIFEFYMRNAKELDILSPQSQFETKDVGKDIHVEKVNSKVINVEDLMELDLNEINELQEEFGYEHPILVDLTPDKPPAEKIYELNEYIWVEDPIKVHRKVSVGIETPDNFVLLIDSSGSMGGPNYVGNGSKYDLLCRVVYGLFKGLTKANELMETSTNVKIINFSSATISSDFIDIKKGFNPGTQLMNVLHLIQDDMTGLDVSAIEDAERKKREGKTLYAFITDGSFNQGPFSNIEYAVNYILNLANKPNNSIVFIEIGGMTSLGSRLNNLQTKVNNLRYYTVTRVNEISDKLGQMLIEYKGEKTWTRKKRSKKY